MGGWPAARAVMTAAVALKLLSTFLFLFFKKRRCSYAVMRARKCETRATPSELHGCAVTRHTHTHACTHAHAPARTPACTCVS